MSKDPAVLFYYQDFLVGTEFMSDDEIGIYIRLLCHLYDKDELSKKQVLSICRASAFENIPDDIKNKLIKDKNGLYFNQRARDEKAKRKAFTESRRNNALGTKTKKASAEHMEDENENKDVNIIYNKWNDKKIIIHQQLTNQIRSKIISTNKDYTTNQIITAIDNYAIILNGDYYFKYKWTLKDFLQRGIDKFLDLQIARDNYKSKPIITSDGRGVKRTHAPLSKERQEEYSKL